MSAANSRRVRGCGLSLCGYPSSVVASRRHLLPQGEKERRTIVVRWWARREVCLCAPTLYCFSFVTWLFLQRWVKFEQTKSRRLGSMAMARFGSSQRRVHFLLSIEKRWKCIGTTNGVVCIARSPESGHTLSGFGGSERQRASKA